MKYPGHEQRNTLLALELMFGAAVLPWLLSEFNEDHAILSSFDKNVCQLEGFPLLHLKMPHPLGCISPHLPLQIHLHPLVPPALLKISHPGPVGERNVSWWLQQGAN